MQTNLINTYLSYYAGFLDGEGHIGIKKKDNYYSERVSVAGTNKLIIEEFNDLIEGYIYCHKPSKLGHKKYWSWEVTNKKARYVLKLLRPYLKVKGLEADIVLALGKNKEKNNSKEVSEKDNQLREDLFQIIKILYKKYE